MNYELNKMRKIISYIYIIGVTLLMAACSNIDENERFIYVKPAEVARCVLLEDYTGQLCVNCPNAAGVIEQLHETYSDNVIAVGIHGGRLSLSSSLSDLGLATTESEEYYQKAGAPAQPSGRINRKGTPSTIDTWQATVTTEIEKTAPVSLELTANYDAESRAVNVNVDAMGVDGNVSGKLQLWIIEDNIVAPQSQPDGSMKTDYVHNHVFRASVNGTWGEDFNITEAAKKTVTATTVLKENWKPEDCSIVAFVYNDSGVMQAAKVKIINDNKE